MTNLEDLKRHFKVLYPNCTVKLYEKFQQFLEDNHSSLPKVLETNFLTFITKIMRVNLSQSMSFSDSLEKLLESKEKINHKVDDKKLIPGFITKNILTMPSNRGYIWKNKKYHGKKNPVEGPEVLFEPRKGKTFIHVYEKMHHKIYQKNERGKSTNFSQYGVCSTRSPTIYNPQNIKTGNRSPTIYNPQNIKTSSGGSNSRGRKSSC